MAGSVCIIYADAECSVLCSASAAGGGRLVVYYGSVDFV